MDEYYEEDEYWNDGDVFELVDHYPNQPPPPRQQARPRPGAPGASQTVRRPVARPVARPVKPQMTGLTIAGLVLTGLGAVGAIVGSSAKSPDAPPLLDSSALSTNQQIVTGINNLAQYMQAIEQADKRRDVGAAAGQAVVSVGQTLMALKY